MKSKKGAACNTPSGNKKANTVRVTMISRRAKQIRKTNEDWTKTIQRASRELKKEGKL